MKTVREAADILGIARQTVYSKLTDTFKDTYTSTNDRGILVISDDGIEELRKGIVKPDSNKDSKATVNKTADVNINDSKIIDLLQEQLQSKDKQIEDLLDQLKVKDNQIENLSDMNKNNQILLLKEKEQNKILELESLEQKEKRSIIDKIKNIFR